jgi:hypothetical protein
MATYLELRGLMDDNDLENRCAVACIVAAEAIMDEDPSTPNHEQRLTFANRAFTAPKDLANRVLMAVLAEYKGLEIAQIQGATDAQLQTAVNNAINVFAQNTV